MIAGIVVLSFALAVYFYPRMPQMMASHWNASLRFNMVMGWMPAFAALFYVCGLLLEKAQRNWFTGIRTPWTLSSDRVWDKTHRLAAGLYGAAAVISLLGVLVKDYAIFFVLVPVIAASVWAVVYSYIGYRKETQSRA